MAIANEIPGLDVTVVGGAALTEHNYDTAQNHDLRSSSTKYVEAASGAEFSIRYLFRPPFTPPSDVLMDIVFDNKYAQMPFVEDGATDGCEGYVYSRATFKVDGCDFTQKFRFSELQTGKILVLESASKIFLTAKCRRDERPGYTSSARASIIYGRHCALLLLHRER